uniref:7TM_GPCR_Srx domain-containing protein n=1 Tax=Caenorhabditis tropicalis TaxID=1561998 RepID=A0A1I7UKA0_9PELO
MQLSINFYLSASIIGDRYLLIGEKMNWLNILFGCIFINAWYMECLVQIVMAVNRYLFQFVFISVFYIFTWILFELLPFIVPENQKEWFSVIPVFITLNCSSNSIIYLTMNRDVQKALQIPWIRQIFGGNKSSGHVPPVQINNFQL